MGARQRRLSPGRAIPTGDLRLRQAAGSCLKAVIDTPVTYVDDEASTELIGTSLVDFLGTWVGELGAQELLGFCRRAGLRPPMPEAECEAALKDYPDPQQVFDFFLHTSS